MYVIVFELCFLPSETCSGGSRISSDHRHAVHPGTGQTAKERPTIMRPWLL